MKKAAGRISPSVVLFGLLLCSSSGCLHPPKKAPETERKPLTDEYHGMKVTDDYRWLENFGDPAVKLWSKGQNSYSRAYLDNVVALPEIRNRLKQLYSNKVTEYSSLTFRGKLFGLKLHPPKNQRFLVVFDSPDDVHSERVVVDPNELGKKGTTAIDWFVPSRDGRLVAVSLSENGSEDGTLFIYEVESGKRLSDVVPRVQYPTGGGSAEWNRDGTGLYYTRYPQGNERLREEQHFYQQVYFHRLGTSASTDRYVIGKEFPKIAEVRLSSTDDGRFLLASVANGDGGDFAHYVMVPGNKWIQVAQFSDKISSATCGSGGMLYLVSHAGASRGRVFALSLERPNLAEAKLLVPEGDDAVSEVFPGRSHLYVLANAGGPSRVHVINLQTKEESVLPLQPMSSATSLVVEGDDLIFRSETYLDPPVWQRYNAADGTVTTLPLGGSSGVRMRGMEVVREFATSKDGTKIPMSIVRREGTTRDGTNPTLLYGYGGFGVSETPDFKVRRLIWLEQGGVYVVAHLRGGGEFGEEWHTQGKLTMKQNVFDDFVACTQYLIDSKYTSRSKLAIEGGSNGGLLMGAVLTQHPELVRAVVSSVGVYDMLRVELFPNGMFNTTEFGTVTDPAQFKVLYAYSPYHNVKDGTTYPAVLFVTGDNDGRVDPANSRKMTARLQKATGSDLPILLRTESAAGHGIGTGLSTRILQEADVYAFLFDQLGIEYKPVVR